MLGLVEELVHITTAEFKDDGDIIVMVGRTSGHVGGSEYLAITSGELAGDAPALDIEYEKRVQHVCLEAIRRGLVKSAHDCSEGGLAIAIAESCILGERASIGARIGSVNSTVRSDFFLFGEDQSRILLSTSRGNFQALLRMCSENNVDAEQIGIVGGDSLVVEGILQIACSTLVNTYFGSIEKIMENSKLT
jgi:phosphoribosylformylglycinamidine synthase